MTPQELIGVCSDIGLRIEPFERRLLVIDERHEPPHVPENLFRLLVEHRDRIRDQLRAGYFCKQVLLHELDGASGAMVSEIRNVIEKHYPSCPARDAALLRLAQEAKRP